VTYNQTAKRRSGTIGTSDRFKDAAGHIWKLTKRGWRYADSRNWMRRDTLVGKKINDQ
jgi:hypothetical protein